VDVIAKPDSSNKLRHNPFEPKRWPARRGIVALAFCVAGSPTCNS
jgi:hypothetical protein